MKKTLIALAIVLAIAIIGCSSDVTDPPAGYDKEELNVGESCPHCVSGTCCVLQRGHTGPHQYH